VRDAHSLLDDTVRVWGEGIAPGDDYGCRCWAEPILDDAGEPVVETVDVAAAQLVLIPAAELIIEAIAARAVGAAAGAGAAVIISENISDDEPEEETEKPQEDVTTPASPPEPPEEDEEENNGEEAPEGGREDSEWSFDKNKSETKWKNQKQKRGWTDEEITKAIKHGKAFRAKNFRNKNPATLYKYKGKYVIRDNVTKEIIQIGGKGFSHPSLP
jgi:hypothetical protein